MIGPTPTSGGPRIGATLERRLAALRATRLAEMEAAGATVPSPPLPHRSADLAHRLAKAIDGEVVHAGPGAFVRIERPAPSLPVDREALARLPTLPGPAATFVCLDTETTGLATASGTVAFLVGLGWWEGDRFRQVQLLLPDHADEPVLLAGLRELLPPDPWLVTYNGRAFDWPLLVARWRMGRERPPELAGHLDLLPLVRRTFRHRLPDARLRTVERELLGLRRIGDVDGWEIPGRYLGFLRGGPADPLADVVRHNDEDVRSLARLVAHLADYLGQPERWVDGHPGDLAAHARALRRSGRETEAIGCLEVACELLGAARSRDPGAAAIAGDRARLLARLRHHEEAVAAWAELTAVPGPTGAVAWVEIAKLREHRLRDPDGALAAVDEADRIAARSRALGHPLAALEADLRRRRLRLGRRIAGRRRAGGDRPARRVPPAPNAPIGRRTA